jgi:hypothetical protein
MKPQIVADILVYDTRHNLELVVITENRWEESPEWAALRRQNLHEYDPPPRAPFFLLALPDHFYLWKNVEDTGKVEPTYDMDPRFFLQPFFKKTNLSLEKLRQPDSFDILIGSALSIITFAEEKNELCSAYPQWLKKPNHQWLFDSSLFDAIKRGEVQYHDCL